MFGREVLGKNAVQNLMDEPTEAPAGRALPEGGVSIPAPSPTNPVAAPERPRA
jgi:hypothetical protein